ncbi:hydroxysqualene dehydroxylase HpnE [uncultured Jannaschia sp.]|uniref:hydroxysqualene dehydroxylase HpnE n=1 Tax=uncultured Jannaschia sp. TaxID=293347 RepID=UPI002638690B|nr:hydroxysqualene dehydroxylase HpnE [uncultured Jannaschia sp.]
MGRIWVIGAGLAGLVAAEWLSGAGHTVEMLEASPKAGGRCRSYRDTRLDRVIDNGNHLILSGNRAVLDWAARIGGADRLTTGAAAFPFFDLATGARWTIRPGPGPLGALRRAARPPGVSARALGRDTARLLAARRTTSVADVVARGPAWDAFWDPMTRAVLNEPPETGSAPLLRAALLRSFARGAGAVRPVFAPDGLGPALVDPALPLLEARGVRIRYRTAVAALRGTDRLDAIETADSPVALGPSDAAILAVPARQAAALLPQLDMPGPGRTIVNAHFLAPESRLPPVLALLGGAAQWLFRRGDVVSVTVSAAEASEVDGLSREDTLARLWRDVAAAIAAHGGTVPAAMPVSRLLREKAATFDQSPDGAARRPAARTPWPNLLLAGDHVGTGLPATLEGAVRSGLAAARLAAQAA